MRHNGRVLILFGSYLQRCHHPRVKLVKVRNPANGISPNKINTLLAAGHFYRFRDVCFRRAGGRKASSYHFIACGWLFSGKMVSSCLCAVACYNLMVVDYRFTIEHYKNIKGYYKKHCDHYNKTKALYKKIRANYKIIKGHYKFTKAYYTLYDVFYNNIGVNFTFLVVVIKLNAAN